jgi:hypothetical protein
LSARCIDIVLHEAKGGVILARVGVWRLVFVYEVPSVLLLHGIGAELDCDIAGVWREKGVWLAALFDFFVLSKLLVSIN